MLELLHSKSLWSQVTKVRGNKPIIAVIAYANKDHLELRAKDTLICDASELRISAGATTYALLKSLAKRKVDLWHLDKLHAKVVRLSEHVVVGSANMTLNSESLVEAAVLTDQVDAINQVDAMLADLRNSGKLKQIDSVFLDRIKKIPVIHGGGGGKRAPNSLEKRKPMSWLMGYSELSDREQKKSDPIVAAMMELDEAPEYFRTTQKAAEKHASIQRGDSLIFVHRTKKRVQRPVTVTGIFPSGNHLFYIYEDVTSGEIAWERVQAKLRKAGLYNRSTIPEQLALDLEGDTIVRGMFRRSKLSC